MVLDTLAKILGMVLHNNLLEKCLHDARVSTRNSLRRPSPTVNLPFATTLMRRSLAPRQSASICANFTFQSEISLRVTNRLKTGRLLKSKKYVNCKGKRVWTQSGGKLRLNYEVIHPQSCSITPCFVGSSINSRSIKFAVKFVNVIKV